MENKHTSTSTPFRIDLFLKESFQGSAENLQQLAHGESADQLNQSITKVVSSIVSSYENKGCLYTAGNGGSAADAQHIAAEMLGKLSKDRTPLKAYAMSVDTSFLTAVGNDYGYDFIFSRQVEGMMSPQDIFLGITTSGNSKNLVKAFEMCQKLKIPSVLLSGGTGGIIAERKLADHVILAPGRHTAQIQEAHIAIYHAMCFAIEYALIASGKISYR
jgi:D-sedoheptulose 7-phosphate isomerase